MNRRWTVSACSLIVLAFFAGCGGEGPSPPAGLDPSAAHRQQPDRWARPEAESLETASPSSDPASAVSSVEQPDSSSAQAGSRGEVADSEPDQPESPHAAGTEATTPSVPQGQPEASQTGNFPGTSANPSEPSAAETSAPASQTGPEAAAAGMLLGEDEPPLLLSEEEMQLEHGEGADNSRCLVCHLNYATEELAVVHAREEIGCASCHGQSDAHIADESWASGGKGTPPDIMYRAEDVIPSCLKCHDLHPADPTCLCPFPRLSEKKLCTDCHGQHRLKTRKCRWK